MNTEPFHASVKNFMQQWKADGTHVVTTNYVILELVVALFISPLRVPRAQQIKTIETIKTSSWVEIVHIDPTFIPEKLSQSRRLLQILNLKFSIENLQCFWLRP